MNEIKNDDLMLPDEIIMNKIYFIRGQKVILDSDLAELYEVETRRLNEQVKRNILRFPEDFMFQLSEAEFENLKSQFATSSWGGRRKLPNIFTEHGVLMLSSVLNSERAINVNIHIMRIFTKIRKVLTDNLSVKLEIEDIKRKLANQDKNIELVFSYLDELIEKQENPLPKKLSATSAKMKIERTLFLHEWKVNLDILFSLSGNKYICLYRFYN